MQPSFVDDPSSALLEAIESIYDAAPNPQLWPGTLGKIANIFNDAGAVLLWRRDDGSFGTIVSESLVAAQLEYEQDWSSRDPLASRAVERGYFFSGEAFADQHLCTPDEFRTDPFFTEFRAKYGLGGIAGIATSPNPQVGVALSLQRRLDSDPHSEADLKLLTVVGRHIEKSFNLSIRLFDSEFARLGLEEALGRVGVAVFTLDSMGRVVFSNLAAKHLLGEDIYLLQGKLCIGYGNLRLRSEAAIDALLEAGVSSFNDAKPILVPRRSSSYPLVVHLLPITAKAAASEQFFNHTHVIVLIAEPKIGEPTDPAIVRDSLNLTLGEARVASLVGAGLPPREAAERLNLSEETVRNVLKRVFVKLGVSRQGELVALLASLALRA